MARAKSKNTPKSRRDPFVEMETLVTDLLVLLGDWQPPSNEEWCGRVNPLMPSTRLAWLSLKKTPAEMEELVRRLEVGGIGRDMIDGIASAGVFFSILAHVCETAEGRLVAYGMQPGKPPEGDAA